MLVTVAFEDRVDFLGDFTIIQIRDVNGFGCNESFYIFFLGDDDTDSKHDATIARDGLTNCQERNEALSSLSLPFNNSENTDS